MTFKKVTAASMPARRYVLALAATCGSLGAARALAESAMVDTPDRLRTSLHQDIVLAAPPPRIYQILLDAKLFSAFSGEPAQINPDAGGAFSLFGARIAGRNVELVPADRIVQAWRSQSWQPGVYSIVKFELAGDAGNTELALDHTGFPPGDFASLSSGWYEHYWRPLIRYLS